MTGEENKNPRQLNMDLLRIGACLLVVLLHVSAQHLNDVSGRAFDVMNIYNSYSRCCVALFFMISGKLFLERKCAPDIPRLFKKNILRLVVIYFVWSAMYAVYYRYVVGVAPGSPGLIMSIINGHYHMWYISTQIGIYLIVPVLFCLVKYENGRYLKYFICVFLLLGIAACTLKYAAAGHRTITALLGMFPCELCRFTGYFVLGCYLSSKDWSSLRFRWPVLIFILAPLATAALYKLYLPVEKPPELSFLNDFSVFVFLQTVSAFIIFLKLPSFGSLSAKKQKAVVYVSKCTLGIYLIHPFIIENMQHRLELDSLSFTPLLSVPALTLLVFAISLAVMLVLNRIPFVNKWLV